MVSSIEVSRYIDDVRQKASKTFGVDKNAVHTGHAILQVFGEFPDFVAQIDAVTGVSNSFKEVHKTTIGLAVALKKYGSKLGDVILLLVPNHLYSCFIIYAGLTIGLPIIPLDPSLPHGTLYHFLNLCKPKFVFCLKDKKNVIEDVLKTKGSVAEVVVIDDGKNNMEVFIKKHNITDSEIECFKPTLFDLNTPAFLLPTSGTTGQPKVAIYNHNNIFFGLKNIYYIFNKFPKPTKASLMVATPQSVSSVMQYLGSALCVFTRIQSIFNFNGKLSMETFSKYKPSFLMCSTFKLLEMNKDGCDLTSLEYCLTGGTNLIESLDKELRTRYPNTIFTIGYGLTEVFGRALALNSVGPYGNVGKEFSNDIYEYRLVDPLTGQTITEPTINGELWIKHKSPFQGYYNNPQETAAAFSEDGYFKTGDILYKDAEGYYYYVDRIKLMMKYKSLHVYPTEIEELLRSHPAVLNAVVTSIKDVECGDIPIGIVVLKEGCRVTASELREVVRKELSDQKQLRGGIIFADAITLTLSDKIDRGNLREFIIGKKAEF